MSNSELLKALDRLREVFHRRSGTMPQWLWRAITAARAQRLTECLEIIDRAIVPFRFEDPEVFLPMFSILQAHQTEHAA